MRTRSFYFFWLIASLVGLTGAEAQELMIAGTQPSQRPETAPFVTEVQKEPGWRDDALAGVTAPYPDSLQFLEAQGNWFTPFSHPGMTGPYDIRGRH